MAASLGYRDGQQVRRKEMLSVIERIARVVAVPVSADMEAGYGDTLEEVAQMASALIAAGAVGLNIEDSAPAPPHKLLKISRQVEKLRAIREAADSAGIPLVINARVDTYLTSFGDSEDRFAETVKRAQAYRQAGADCIFPILLDDAATIGRLVGELRCPVNILAGPNAPSIRELEALPIARVSFGSGPMRAALGALQQVARELGESGTYNSLKASLSSAEFRELFPPWG